MERRMDKFIPQYQDIQETTGEDETSQYITFNNNNINQDPINP